MTMTISSGGVLPNGYATLSAVTDNDNGTYSAITTYTNMNNPHGNIAFSAYSVIRAKINGHDVVDTVDINFY